MRLQHNSLLGKAKSLVDIPSLWNLYSFPGSPSKNCRCPFHEDRNPSFSVYCKGGQWYWKCYSSCGHGDAITFIAKAEGIFNSDACCRIIELAGLSKTKLLPRPIIQPRRIKPYVAHESKERPEIAKQLRLGTDAELEALARLRNFPPGGLGPFHLLQDRGLQRFYDSGGVVYWAITDKTRQNVQIRRLDGLLVPIKGSCPVKAKTAYGARASWTIGTPEAKNCSRWVILEGGPDLLAAAYIAFSWESASLLDLNDLAFLCVTGAGQRLCRECLNNAKGKIIRIFPHTDEPGQKAARRWRRQLIKAGAAYVDQYLFEGLFQNNDQPVTDLCEFLNLDIEQALSESGVSIVMPYPPSVTKEDIFNTI